ncbi:MAG: hypothetical protein JG777_2194 [Clostridia bacterium]|jgi:polysaccharide pyruvyl transferase WcaK-like protein|nr:hypothetical protein [Clostridia bacterium]
MKTQIKKIAFTGPFADVNFGDYAMLVNNIYDLDVRDIILFSYDDYFLNKIKNDYLNQFNVEITEVKLFDNHNKGAENHLITPIELLNKIKNYQEIAEKIEEADVLIVNGGGYFNGLWSKSHRIERLTKIMAPILVANQQKKRIVFTGNSYGPFGEDADFFACFFNVLDNVTFGCRDNLYSPMWLKQIGVNDEKLKYLPDDLFLINNNILIQKQSHSIVTQNYIVMETYLPLDFIKTNLEHFKNFSKKMFRKYGLSIVFLPFNLEHGGMHQAQFLNSVLDNYQFFDIAKKGYLPIQDAVEIIKGAELVVSTRYHALVIALAVGTPIISVLKDVMDDKRYYYNKNYGMLRQGLKGIPFDERYYLRLDYLDALDFIADNFNTIINLQNHNYNSQYISNKEKLKLVRKNYLETISNNKS